MGFFKNQLSNVVEWEEFRDDMIFWKWDNDEIKKGSKLFIRPGQDAIFFKNAKIEGIFTEDGEYDIESQIIPFLSSLKGFKFGFNSGLRAEVLFVNTKEFTVKWGTKGAINIPTQQLPGGMPIRANGTFNFKVVDYVSLIENIAGVKTSYLVEDVKIRITSILDQLLMKWITKAGQDMFNLQANAMEIGDGIKQDLNSQVIVDGISITRFTIMSFNYPENIQKMIEKTAAHSMVTDVNKYSQMEMVDGMTSGKMQGGGTASDMMGMMMGMNMANNMMNNMQNQMNMNNNNMQNQNINSTKPNFCPNCGAKTSGTNFCSNCGAKLI